MRAKAKAKTKAKALLAIATICQETWSLSKVVKKPIKLKTRLPASIQLEAAIGFVGKRAIQISSLKQNNALRYGRLKIQRSYPRGWPIH